MKSINEKANTRPCGPAPLFGGETAADAAAKYAAVTQEQQELLSEIEELKQKRDAAVMDDASYKRHSAELAEKESKREQNEKKLEILQSKRAEMEAGETKAAALAKCETENTLALVVSKIAPEVPELPMKAVPVFAELWKYSDDSIPRARDEAIRAGVETPPPMPCVQKRLGIVDGVSGRPLVNEKFYDFLDFPSPCNPGRAFYRSKQSMRSGRGTWGPLPDFFDVEAIAQRLVKAQDPVAEFKEILSEITVPPEYFSFKPFKVSDGAGEIDHSDNEPGFYNSENKFRYYDKNGALVGYMAGDGRIFGKKTDHTGFSDRPTEINPVGAELSEMVGAGEG